MQSHLRFFALAGAVFLSSCATIVSHSNWPVALSSAPVGATVTVVNRANKEIFSGTTPTTVTLRSSAGFFQRAKYKINFSKPGFSPKVIALEADLNGWYFGNLLIGGALGMLIIDPATGAMYRIDQRDVQAALVPTTGFNNLNPTNPTGLHIVALEEVPQQLRGSMTLVSPAK